MDALGLRMWKHPQPHCVESMHHTGKLKVTHKVRINFSVGNYTDMVICDILPMDACQLLLGRPWQYDSGATHDGRSNTYSFWNNGKRHVLRPMFANAIKVDAIISVPNKIPRAITKPRTALFQEGGDDVATRGSLATTRSRGNKVLFAQEKNEDKRNTGSCTVC